MTNHSKLFAALILICVSTGFAQTPPAGGYAEKDYSTRITNRATRSMDAAKITDEKTRAAVLSALTDHFRFLRKTYDERDQMLIESSDSQQVVLDKIRQRLEPALPALVAKLSAVLPQEQVEKVLDDVTFNEVPNMMAMYEQSFPNLTDEHKKEIRKMLLATRDVAVNEGTSEDKMFAFRKVRIQINRFLAQNGYDWKKQLGEWDEKQAEKRLTQPTPAAAH